MTHQELAKLLHKRLYGQETTPELTNIARNNNLVIAYMKSSQKHSGHDLVFEGAKSLKIPYGGLAFLIKSSGWYPLMVDSDYYADTQDFAIGHFKSVECPRDKHDNIYAHFAVLTDYPHSTFDIDAARDELDGELVRFCRGIVFSLEDIK